MSEFKLKYNVQLIYNKLLGTFFYSQALAYQWSCLQGDEHY